MSSSEELTPDEKSPNGFVRIYRGLTTIDFLSRTKIYFAISVVIIVAGLGSIALRGLNLGIDFKGGTAWEVIATSTTTAEVTKAVEAAGASQPTVFILGGSTVHVEADLNALTGTALTKVENDVANALAKIAHKSSDQVSVSTVGPTWGGTVTNRALIALLVFFVAVVIYISGRFEPKMAISAFVAMVHDLLITMGIYSIFGFQITPDTVIALLTILGYSLYDTVVVFDRVRDNTKGILNNGSMSYSDMINLSMNQTLARSINTSLVAILPVLSVLFVGAELLGATTLREYGLALFVGLMAGAYSSLFIASPLLALLKEREPRMIDLRNRLAAKGARTVMSARSAAELAGGGGSSRDGSSSKATITAKARKQKRR
ncbi:MAG: protein translocase subunit SecF [Actinomycetes bacterium]|jgi:preprotein translocase subunit SecF